MHLAERVGAAQVSGDLAAGASTQGRATGHAEFCLVAPAARAAGRLVGQGCTADLPDGLRGLFFAPLHCSVPPLCRAP